MAIGDLNQQLDNTEYDIGIFRAANCKLKLRNDHGLYSPAGTIESLFKFRRGGSKIRIRWEAGDERLCCGFFTAGHPSSTLSEPVTLFEGLLDDIQTKTPVDDQTVEFLIQGYESLLAQISTPYSSISNGDTIALTIYRMLNQAPFTTHVTVLQANITPSTSFTIDNKTSLENQTVVEGLKDLLLASNSVLYVRDNIVYVKPRTATTDLQHTWYGPAAEEGIENILDIDDFRSGEHRIINFVTWQDTSLMANDVTSVTKYGARKKEIKADVVTNNTQRTTIITAIKDEFANPKREMILMTPLDKNTVDLFLLDRVSVDYPSEYVVAETQNVAIYEIGEYDVDYYAAPIARLEIESTARFKIMSRRLSFDKFTMAYGLREI